MGVIILNRRQKKYTILSAIFSVLSLISAIITIVTLSGIGFGESSLDAEAEGPFVLVAVLIGALAILIATAIVILIGSFFVGGFAIASYKCASVAAKCEEQETKAILPKVLSIISAIELTIAAGGVLFIAVITVAAFVV